MNRRPAGSVADEFARFFSRCITTESGCIVRSSASKTYGDIRYDGGRIATHRASYIANHGPIPAGLLVRHRCDNPPCVNPRHLLVGTHGDNHQDAKARGRLRTGMAVRCGQTMDRVAQKYGASASSLSRWIRGAGRADSHLEPVQVGRGSSIARGLLPHGTPAAYRRHRLHGEPACDPCRAAYNAYCLKNRHAREGGAA